MYRCIDIYRYIFNIKAYLFDANKRKYYLFIMLQLDCLILDIMQWCKFNRNLNNVVFRYTYVIFCECFFRNELRKSVFGHPVRYRYRTTIQHGSEFNVWNMYPTSEQTIWKRRTYFIHLSPSDIGSSSDTDIG